MLAGSDRLGGAQIGFFCLSMLAFALAFYLIWKGWKTPAESERFRSLRKITRKKTGEKSDKSQAK
jgi:hypothetical protein